MQSRRLSAARMLIPCGIVLLASTVARAQCTAGSPADQPIQQLFTHHEWQQVVIAAARIHPRSASVNFAYGMALAHLDQAPAARAALIAGARQCPRQQRFPIELGGLAFEQKQYPEAARWLRRGLRLDPADAYANNFAATVYYLMGNVEAALKFWNLASASTPPGKPAPMLADVHLQPGLRLQRGVLDRAFVFSPQAQLTLPAYQATLARLANLGVYPSCRVTLAARPEGSFDADFHAIERDGFGSSRVQALISTFAGAAYETIYPSYFNFHGADLNLESLLRWDKEKRRYWADVSAPVYGRPQLRWRMATDERNENWVIRKSSTGTAAPLGSLNLDSQSVAASLHGLRGGAFSWTTGLDVSRRTYRSIDYGSALTPSLLTPGYQLKFVAGADFLAISRPERRFTLNTSARSETARLWSAPARTFEKLSGGAMARWFPQAQGDKYELTQQLRAGGMMGATPFSELYLLGMERDSNLQLRGESGTRDGRKGSSPLASNYLLANTDFYRRLYSNGLFTIQGGPLLDLARVSAPTPGLASRQWIVNTGVTARLSVLGAGIALSYGRDLRTGNNVFFGALTQ